MSLQCKTLRSECAAHSSFIPDWLRKSIRSAVAFHSAWAYQKQIAKSRRMLENLPEHIRHDIGWPCIEDRLPAPGQNSRNK
ncbi:DUF1127 domain-containing protein [Brucella gallinifaecis]|uniref:DUF1127 domain-containing protein n=1 Tax=Brucella gallinifaecis TaxID=215590 RepID=A0A502BQD5_9HYPH|nr:DUF1127 domain-containing protein [Brucella gallinifaecis]TPF76762.1 DUF1127 domain-containing protein [Brucella gallinifaecis]